MRLKVNFKHLAHTEALDRAVKEKSEKLGKAFKDISQTLWTCSVEKGIHFAEVKIIGPTFEFLAKAKSENLYKSLDLAIDKIEKQIAKKKDKWKNHIHRKGKKSAEFHEDAEAGFADKDEGKFDDVA